MEPIFIELLSIAPQLAGIIYIVTYFLRHLKERDAALNEYITRLDTSHLAREERMCSALEKCAAALGELRGTIGRDNS
jgi:hypothetical protein